MDSVGLGQSYRFDNVNKIKEVKNMVKNCMFQDKICSDSCKGWDYEHNDCRLIGMLWKITEAINYFTNTLLLKKDMYKNGLSAEF